MKDKKKICVVFTHHKLGDLIWQIPYIEAISNHFNQKINLVVREKTQAKEILKDCKFINDIHYNNFRKKIFYFYEIFKLWKYYKSQNFSHIFFLDKVNRGPIAAKLANIPVRIGFGFKNQKRWLTDKNLNIEHVNKNQSEQSRLLLETNNIKINNLIPNINVNNNRLIDINPDITKYKGSKICMAVDSFELYKMWYEEYFAELANRIHQEKFCDFFYLISAPHNNHIVEKIIQLSKRNIFINCSNLNLMGIIKVIKDSKFMIGNNTGPVSLASALNVKSYALIANTPVSELKYSRIIPILPDDYVNDFLKKREEMSKLSVDKVYDFIFKK